MDWDARYQAGDTPWEKGSFAPPLKEIQSKFGPEIWKAGPVLVPGCGFGHDARWIAKRGAEVVGLDISEHALQEARKRTEESNPEFRKGDFFQPEEAAFAVIFEHTCFCAIDPSDRERYVAAASRWLAPGGLLVAIFFLNPGRETGPPHGCDLEELDELFGQDFTVEAEWEPQLAYPGREGREYVRVLRKC